MKKSKSLIKVLVSLVIILAIIFVVLILRSPKSVSRITPEEKGIENLPIKEAKAQSYAAGKILSLKEGDKIFGSKDATLKIFVYEDNASPYSAKLADTLNKLYSEQPTKLAIIVRPFVSKNSDLSQEAALAVMCASESDKWIAMRALLFAQTKNNNLNFADFGKYATQVGLDEKLFADCLTNKEKSAKIDELSAEAASYNVYGAPTIFIGDEMILGARPYADYVDSNGDSIEGLKTTIDKKLK